MVARSKMSNNQIVEKSKSGSLNATKSRRRKEAQRVLVLNNIFILQNRVNYKIRVHPSYPSL